MSGSRFLAVALALIALVAPGRARAQETPAGVIVHRVGFTSNQFPGTATRDAAIAIDYWFKIMSDRQKTAQIPKTTVYDSFGEMHEAMRKHRLDIVVILSRDYLAVRDEIELDPFCTAVRSREGLPRFAVYVPRTKGIRGLSELKGRKIVFDETEGAELGRLWFETRLLQEGLDPENFGTFQPVDKASKAVLPVYFGQADACVAPTPSFSIVSEMNPRVGRDLVALEVSQPMAPAIVCYTDQMDPARKPDITQTLLTLHEDPEGQQVLNLFRRDHVLLYDPSQIQPIVDLELERERILNRMKMEAGP